MKFISEETGEVMRLQQQLAQAKSYVEKLKGKIGCNKKKLTKAEALQAEGLGTVQVHLSFGPKSVEKSRRMPEFFELSGSDELMGSPFRDDYWAPTQYGGGEATPMAGNQCENPDDAALLYNLHQ